MSTAAKWIHLLIGASAITLSIGGCASTSSLARGGGSRSVELSEFVKKDAAASSQAAAPAPTPATAAASGTAAAGETSNPSADTATPVAAGADSQAPPAGAAPTASAQTTPAAGNQPAAPLRPGERLTQPGDVVVIDSLIGQVSGRPIFADALLEPIADQLRQLANRVSPQEFTQRASLIISDRLKEVVLNELFIAEAEASLTPEQQQGLLAFLRNLQEKTIASGTGSRSVTEQRLLEETGMTIEQYTERERNTVLIRTLIYRKIAPRVIVSWKDVQREYEKRKREFNPPSSVTLQIVRLSNKDQQEQIEQIKSRLAAGESFEDVVKAVAPQELRTPDPFQMRSDDVADIDINEAWKPALSGLKVGQTTAPIDTDGRTTWLHVAKIDQPPGKSLYDVQKQLTNELQIRRENEERNRYITSLFAKGIHDELSEMGNRLLSVALMRYGK